MKRLEPEDLKKLLSRPGVRLEVGQPFQMGGESRKFMCMAKFVVPTFRVRRITSEPPGMDDDQTNTICIVSEEGTSPRDAHRKLMNRLGDARSLTTFAPSKPRRGWLGRLIRAFA